MRKKLSIIINPASGQDLPILALLNRSLQQTDFDWEIFVTIKGGDASKFAEKSVKEKVDVIAVYGGDGTLCEVATFLCHSKIPLGVIPGGSANLIAKSLNIPVTIPDAINIITRKNLKTVPIDMIDCNGQMSLEGINFGLIARTIKHTDRALKDRFGDFAYQMTALKELNHIRTHKYELELDGKKKNVEGVALVVFNTVRYTIAGLPILPDSSIHDGLLDVILVKKPDLEALVELAKSVTTGQRPQNKLKYWQARHVMVKLNDKQNVLADDVIVKNPGKVFDFKIVPKALEVVIL